MMAAEIAAWRLLPIHFQNHLKSCLLYSMYNKAGKFTHLSRRELLKLALGAAAALPFSRYTRVAFAETREQPACANGLPPQTQLSDNDQSFLEELEKANFAYFWEQ